MLPGETLTPSLEVNVLLEDLGPDDDSDDEPDLALLLDSDA